MAWTQQWLELIAPDEPHKLERRLAWDQWANSNAFAEWLSAPPQIETNQSKAWQEALTHCQGWLQCAWDQPLQPVQASEQRPFVDLWLPVRDGAAAELRAALERSAGLDRIGPNVVDQLADSLLNRLCAIGEQVLWDQFNTGRTPGAMLLAHLGSAGDGEGPPVRELYTRFITTHRRDGLQSLLTTFPVLGRFIGTVVALWHQGSLEMLERIQQDRSILAEHCSIPRDWCLQAVQQGLSDPHRGGRAVAILSFTSPDRSNSHRLVYKPKDMGVDAAYQALIKDLNANSELPPLRSLVVQTCDGYGYMEYVSHTLCTNAEELERFYRNAGRLTALLHLLGCTDCHHENLIASGDQLVLIDTETLLEADLPDHIQAAAEAAEHQEPSGLQQRFRGSVLRSGLLPQWLFMGQAKQAIDISALGIAPPAKEEITMAGWLGINSDGMMPGRINRAAECPTSLPVGFGHSNPLSDHLEPFCAGFRLQAQELLQLRERWLSPDSPLDRFEGLPRRIVLRATRVYFALQRQQLEASALRTEEAQALRLEQLGRSFLLAESKPLHWPVFAAEREQMQRLDIPFFTHPIDRDGLELDEKGSLLPGFIETSGLASARKRLRAFNAAEIDFQERLIRGAVQARILKQRQQVSPSEGINQQEAPPHPAPAITAVEAATTIAQTLLDLAIRDPQGQIEWLGMDLGADGESFSFGPVGLSLYGGSIGIACLLKRLQALGTAPAKVEAIQAAILKPLHDLVGQAHGDGLRRWWRDQPLGLSGCGGILLALLEIGETELAAQLLKGAQPRFIEADQQWDVIGGCAGLIGPLLQLRSTASIELAVLAGDRLLQAQDANGSWRLSTRHSGLLGFSHGTAGYSAALARLHQATDEERFLRAARQAVSHERGHFHADVGNWPDFRGQQTSAEGPSYMVSWCHGAPGIALGRACLWGTELWDDQCAEELSIALETTASIKQIRMDHLCCGSLGLMVLLRDLAQGPWPLSERVQQLALAQARQIQEQALDRCQGTEPQLRCFGTQEGNLVLPGFFTGLSGMALALLDDRDSQCAINTLLSAGLLKK
ncbi:Lanthionine biosynthesis protein LanM [Synechococcus sp. WH 8101]|uniref:type 2 lanthipeptide synthetase LanM family protein n=1 Tax=Synechococcus sp. WH 8101 TaxID=59932 RepID=UPI001022A761|nr:type 2 lanthipeptide synthetase LanM family protein [Synechococcus sp. WH 8101]QBE69405.1 Lanthionine biosynthesis protein LanM [Synechococcus sp. WH 8101]